MDELIVFTDGSCLSNGLPSARAGCSMVWPFHPQFTAGQKLRGHLQTNNRAEFTSALMAMETARIIDPSCQKTLVIYTDSNLLLKTCTEWLPVWKTRGWKTSQNKTIANKDLVEQLDYNMTQRPVRFHFVKAHTNKTDWESTYNDMADKLARRVITQ